MRTEIVYHAHPGAARREQHLLSVLHLLEVDAAVLGPTGRIEPDRGAGITRLREQRRAPLAKNLSSSEFREDKLFKSEHIHRRDDQRNHK